MNRSTCIILGLVTGFSLFARGEMEYCRHEHGWFAAADGEKGRKYAPSRMVDILHLAIDVTPDFGNRSVIGEVTVRFKPIAKALTELRLDAVDLNIQSVESSAKLSGWHSSVEDITVTFDPPLDVQTEATVTVRYLATPRKGLYFRTPEMGYKAGDTHLWTQGEPTEARHWYPSFDAPNEKFTSEVTCRVPEGMVVLSNGKLVSEEKRGGKSIARWLQDKPHVNYLIALVAGNLKKIEDKYRDIPLAFYTPASQIEHAMNSFKDTKDMMAFFEKEIGVLYPWAKYYQVCVDDFGWGGMENTSLTILNERTLHPKESEPLVSSQGLIAHELAHQWFGDLVTCKDWSHIWLNEGFATYYDALYDGHKNGHDELLYSMYQSAKGIIAQPNQTNAMVRRDWERAEELFNYLAYPKGAWVLHMLRSQLGPELFRECVKTYLERFQFGNAETEDLNGIIENLSGRNFDRFFDQWVYHAGFPDVQVSYAWDQKTKLAKLTLAQNQKLSEDVLLFQFPLTVRFKNKRDFVERQIVVRNQSEDFYFPLPEAPEIVRVDPNLTVLARFNFTPPTAMVNAQLNDKSDMLGRLIAAEQLGAKKDADAVKRLKEVLNDDPSYAVRIAAARSLRGIKSDESFQALVDSRDQKDARVRDQVYSALDTYYRERTLEVVMELLPKEKNPEIQAQAVRALGAYSRPEAKDVLLKQLSSKSHRNRLAEEAIQAMRSQADPAYLDPIIRTLKERESDFSSAGFARGLEAVAFLARHEEQKAPYRELLLQHVNSKKQRVQSAAINGLGNLGDPSAITVLEKFASSPKDSPERTAAERAIASLRDDKKPSVELGSIRGEVLALQRENRDLRKDLDDLKKKLEALAKPVDVKVPKATRKPAKK